uniref:Zinc finger, CCHC-type n=1 Tax=Tanacetum cinerariifolium TaxID=118510 RepID=A0A699J0S7_TANCI|nr:zinc finger, CCHC-type [Tanacetum cinerariifolium]
MVAAAMKHMASNFAKLDKFEGVDFKRWQKKMHFLLSSISVVYVLTTLIPDDGDDATVDQLMKRAKRDNDDYVCRGLIVNGMSDSLFDIYQNIKSFKELWDYLEAKYMAEDASSSHLRIEESHKMQDSDKSKGNNVAGPSVVNMVKHNNSFKYNDNKGKREKAGNKANGSSTNGLVDGSTNSLKGLSQGFWGEAMLTACYLLNRVPNKRNKITPYELWTKKKPNLNYLRVWGCRAVVRLPNPKLKTLGKRGIKCIFVGYAENSKAFSFYVIKPNDSVFINSIIRLRDAIFDENRFSSVPRPSLRILNGTEDIGGLVVPKEITEEKEAINDEMDFIMGNNTWVLADLPLGCKPLGCKWIFKIKLKVDGTIEKCKSRLVIQGFKQKSRIDYFDTYAPVKRISTIRLLITMASIHNLIIHQMDVKTAFLNGDLDEEVYMNQTQGSSCLIMPGNEIKVCKFTKSLYGLKHAPKQWHQKFNEVVLSNGYLLNQADKYVYRKFNKTGKGVIICLYVDDILIFGTDHVQVDLTKEFLSSRFSMKDMGEADVILGIRIKYKGNGTTISQSHYIKKVLKKFNYSDCTPVSTHMDTSEKLMPNNGQAVS